MQTKTKVIVALLVGVLVAIAVLSIRSTRKPATISLVGVHLTSCVKGEKLNLKAELKNPSLFGVRVESVYMTCGCSTPGRPLENLLLRPFETQDVTFTVDTSNKIGPVNFGGVVYSRDFFGNVHVKQFSIPVEVKPPWYLSKNQVFLTQELGDGGGFHDSIWLFDHKADVLLEIESVVSQFEGFDAEVLELVPGSEAFHECSQFLTKKFGQQHDLRPRYKLSFDWQPVSDLTRLKNRIDVYVKGLDCEPVAFMAHINRGKPMIKVFPKNLVEPTTTRTTKMTVRVRGDCLEHGPISVRVDGDGFEFVEANRIEQGFWKLDMSRDPDVLGKFDADVLVGEKVVGKFQIKIF